MDKEYREELKEVRAQAIRRRLDCPVTYKENFWYKVNPYAKRKVFVDPPQGELPDHVREIMLKELLKAEKRLLKERKIKLKAIKEIDKNVQWFFEILESAEFVEYYHIQKWIAKLYYGHLRES